MFAPPHNHRIFRFSVILLSFAILTGVALAKQYRMKTWTVEDGLPQNVIRGIAQTEDGYL